ncbi:hypothetical protein BWI97_08720 [Siphonobacter sp. BAB-5405]|uniref:hypothetical protein n=1 Tax=Siphonobacter sp. BAB-5405 TaxID=1864825 RepID=UPI000C7FE6AD|nr:hypothetical protein [Siphonobacter sp. BAB-5405]PMD97682.1 hypothetical protein BWI97_08720 [Siphonobacter sp. BAB-5405]
MRFIFSLFFACLLPVLGYSQKQQTGNDSIQYQINQLSKEFKALKQTNDSLNKELYYFRAKEDYYALAVDRQGTHFEFLITTIIALVGFISWGYFRSRFQSIENQNEEQKKEVIEMIDLAKKDIKELNSEFCINMGLVFQNTPLNSKFNVYGEVEFNLHAVKFYSIAIPLTEDEPSLKVVKLNLIKALQNSIVCCKKLSREPKNSLPKFGTNASTVMLEQIKYTKDTYIPRIFKFEDEKMTSRALELAVILKDLDKILKENTSEFYALVGKPVGGKSENSKDNTSDSSSKE